MICYENIVNVTHLFKYRSIYKLLSEYSDVVLPLFTFMSDLTNQ